MKRRFTKAQIVELVKNTDKRALKLSDEQIDTVIDAGYAEMATVYHLFSNEEIIDLAPIYDSMENKFTIDIEEDVVDVYEFYLSVENQSYELYEHGIKEITNVNAIYLDSRYKGRVHINLSRAGEICNNVVIKYFYTPKSTDEDVYMDQPTYLAVQNAFAAALLDRLHDVERSMQKLAAMKRTVTAAIPKDPKDLITDRVKIFPAGV